jgi:AmiR/NasT family two-component response regulator
MEGVDAARATARLATGLAEAMRSRAVIEQAKGILIGDKRVSADEAFALLVRMSQNANVKVRDVAQRLVDERSRPG